MYILLTEALQASSMVEGAGCGTDLVVASPSHLTPLPLTFHHIPHWMHIGEPHTWSTPTQQRPDMIHLSVEHQQLQGQIGTSRHTILTHNTVQSRNRFTVNNFFGNHQVVRYSHHHPYTVSTGQYDIIISRYHGSHGMSL